jgi:hypothetical protein
LVDDTKRSGTAREEEEPRQAGTDEPAAESVSDRWIELFAVDEAVDLHPEMFDEAIRDLDRLLQLRPDAKQETIAILDRQFKPGLRQYTWPAVTSRLADYWGEGPAYLLNWLVYSNTESRLAAVERTADAPVASYLRSVVASCWDDLNAAQYLITTSADDWTRIEKHVYYDRLTETVRLSANLSKVSGETVTLEFTPDSVLNLAGHLLVMIAAVGSRDEFSEQRVSMFLELLGPVLSLLTSSELTDDAHTAHEQVTKDADG